MLERIQAGACDIWVLFEIPCAIEKRMRTAPMMATPSHIMFERVKSCDFGILCEIPTRTEKRTGITAFACPKVEIMFQRIQVCGGDVRIVREIPRSIENRVRSAPFLCAPSQVMR